MMILVTYDVSFKTETGPKRLRRMAKLCQVYGQRVQYSVFEIEVDMAQWTALKNDLIKAMDEDEDSLRFYLEHFKQSPMVSGYIYGCM